MERSPSTARAVAQFALAGLVVLALFLVGSMVVSASLGRTEAVRDARQFAVLTGQGIVEPALRNGLVAGDARALAAVDRIVQERVLGERIARVKIWTRRREDRLLGRARLVGETYPLDEEKLDVLESGRYARRAEQPEGAENRFERGLGELYEVYLGIRAPDGTPLVFETYQRASRSRPPGGRIWLPFAALLLVCLLLLWLVQVPLAWRLARRLETSQEERERLLERALEASADERRRIAGDLHDGVVQDLAGISYSLARRPSAATRPRRSSAATVRRGGGRHPRQHEAHPVAHRRDPPAEPARLGARGRAPGLVAPLAADGVETSLDVETGLDRGASSGSSTAPRARRSGTSPARTCVAASPSASRSHEGARPAGGRATTASASPPPSASAVATKGTSASRCSRSSRGGSEGASMSVPPGAGTSFELEAPSS